MSIYEKTIIINGYLSQQNTNPVLIYKLHQVNFYFMFNYYFINKDILASDIKAVTNIHNSLSM